MSQLLLEMVSQESLETSIYELVKGLEIFKAITSLKKLPLNASVILRVMTINTSALDLTE